MPEITISMAAGRTDEQKAGMMRDITKALATNLGVDADAVVIQINEAPLARVLVHHNQVENTMLGCNDYGGLEHFQGGPVYLYDNVIRNCVGNRTLGGELGYSLYLDGALAGTFTGAGPATYDGTQFLTLGNWGGGGGRNFNGAIDDVAIFNHVLAPSDIATITPMVPITAYHIPSCRD